VQPNSTVSTEVTTNSATHTHHPVEAVACDYFFEAVACDYFFHKGWCYFTAADRLSGWTEQTRIQPGTTNSGAKGLCTTFRQLFSTFGVPVELSSDEFIAGETKAFLKKWGVRHRQSSSYFLSSNGRAELAVKSTKRLLMDNIDKNGDLNNDRVCHEKCHETQHT